jgi:shikimate dehydrogenase
MKWGVMTGDRVPELLYFIGVSTSESSIMRLFPRWAGLLGLDASIVGKDIPLESDPEDFRSVVEQIAQRPEVKGGLVTTHKIDVFNHARDLFAEVDMYARISGEVSCISKRDGGLVAHAKDPITSGLALDHMIGADYWARHSGQVVCMGAGGAGVAIVIHLLQLEHPPPKITLTDVSPTRIDAARRAHEQVPNSVEVEYRLVRDPAETDDLISSLPPTSLVVNATGMGKDRPGSPITDAATFPALAVVWDLNYRGELRFLRQARAQERARDLDVHDGWRYFLHGWTEVISEVFEKDIDEARFGALAAAAEELRSPP